MSETIDSRTCFKCQHCERWTNVAGEPDYKNMAAEIDRLTALVEQKWIKIKDRKPEHGQWIFGCTDKFDPWYEQYDQDEPHGLMRYWCPAPPPTQQESES